jgi:hypothetical protein
MPVTTASRRSVRSILSLMTAAALTVGALTAVPQVGFAQPEPSMRGGGGGGGGGGGARGEMPKFDEVVKDMQAVPGLMTLYRNDPTDASKDHTRLLALVPRSLLKQDLLMANSVSRGSNFGFPLDDGVLVRWEQVGNRLMLMAPDTRLKDDGRNVINEAVRSTYRPVILAGLPIISMDASGGVLVDLSSMIYSGVSGVQVAPRIVRRDLSRVVAAKAFPENVLIDVDLALGDMSGQQPLSTVGVSYAFRRLPASGSYSPRLADERVGYFTTVRQDWTTKYDERDTITRYINRWDVKKQDPSLELSPPEKPIVFIIEKTVPIQFRKYVAEGILEWNKAYEAVGISGAIVVQQQTDDNEFANVDPEDARYNFIRWIVTGNGFAMGPSRPDPRTGQLLDADIIFDDSMVRLYIEESEILGPKALASSLGEGVIEFYRENPAFLPTGATLPKSDKDLLREQYLPRSAGDTPGFTDRLRGTDAMARQCSIGNGLRQRLSMARLAVQAGGGKKIPDRLVGEIVKDITSHEVGHTLGLRHNFKGSTWLTTEEIKKRRDAGDTATTASTMDYNELLYFPGDKIESLKHITTPTIGPYDMWAIQYGYSSPERGKSETEHLAAIATKTNLRENAYASDEDVTGFSSADPMANRWDMSADPTGWAKMRLAHVEELMKDVRTWAIKKDEPNYYFRSVLGTLMFERVRTMPYIARFVTGQMTSKSRPGDPNAVDGFVLLPPAQQREALKFLNETLFSDTFFDMDPTLFNISGASRWWDWASNPASRTDYPYHSAILSMQSGTLASLTSPASMQRVYDAERKTAADDKFTAAELINSVRDGLFGDLDKGGRFTDAKPMLSSIKRNLQQQYIQNMLSVAELRSGTSVSPDLQNMVRFSLRELSARIGKATENKDRLDFATRAHLTEAKIRIDRVLDAPFVPSGGGGGPIIIMMGQTPEGQSNPPQGDIPAR